MSHTPEPWIVNGSIRIESEHEHGIVNDGWIIGDLSGPDAKANARRIVLCVNYCAGEPDAALELFTAKEQVDLKIKFAEERDKLRELCGELIQVLRITESWLHGWASADSELSQIKLGIKKAEKALGGNDGNSN